MSHTPGPWSFDRDWGRLPTIFAADGKIKVAIVEKVGGTGDDRSRRTSRQEADALLIAAAPEIYEALFDLVAACTVEVNEKGAGGYLLARLSDAKDALEKAAPGAKGRLRTAA